MSVNEDRFFLGLLQQVDCSGKKSPLLGMLVDVFLVTLDASDSPQFTKINETPAKTDDYGFFWFNFADPTRLMIGQSAVYATNKGDDTTCPTQIEDPNTPASDEHEDLEEFRKRYPHLIPNLDQPIERRLKFAYRVTVLIEMDEAARTSQSSSSFKILEVMDDRNEPSEDWGRSLNPESRFIPESAIPVFRRVRIPASNTEAAMLAGDTVEKASNPALKQRGNSFAFLGVGRATWDEIGGFAETRPEFIGKSGYFRSADTWKSNPNNVITRLPKRYDAPFAGNLEIHGVFGGDLSDKSLYYSLTFSRYTGDLSKPFDPNFLSEPKPWRRTFYAYFYEFFSTTTTEGKWKSEQLGPYSVSVDGKSTFVYRRRLPRPGNVESWPNPTQLAQAIVFNNITDLENGLWVMTVRAFERIGGTETAPTLQEIPLDSNPRAVMVLVVDRDKIVLKFDKLYPSDPISYVKLQLVKCKWGAEGESYSIIKDVTECNEVSVNPGQVSGNEGILVRFTIGDRKGDPHKHWLSYSLTAEYSPRSTSDSPDKKKIALRPAFAGSGPLFNSYDSINPIPGDPTTPVSRQLCILLPVVEDGWPPEKGDSHMTPCNQYGVGLQLEAFSRQIDGSWETYYLPDRTARYIVLRNEQAGCT